MQLNEKGEWMDEHHVKYKKLHGVDETVFMTRSEHKKLHMRLRREGKCNVPPDELNKISHAARRRTGKPQKYLKDMQRISFSESYIPNIQLHEEIRYNPQNWNVSYYSGFTAHHNQKLPVIDVGALDAARLYNRDPQTGMDVD